MPVNRHKKFKDPDLHVVAVDSADVRQVEPDGSVLPFLRIVGKTHDESTYQQDLNGLVAVMDWHVVPGGVKVPFSTRVINELKLGNLKPGNAETAALAGLSFAGSK
jgi:hypothetical protein